MKGADRIRVLSLNSHFDKVPLWQCHTTSIASLDPAWHSKSILPKFLGLLKNANYFDVILFYHDIRLAALFGTLRCIRKIKSRLVFQEFWFDVAHRCLPNSNVLDELRRSISRLLHKVVACTMDIVIVHTSEETKVYSDYFDVPNSRFKFIPYFGYPDAVFYSWVKQSKDTNPGYVLAAGRNRDFRCFVTAITNTPWRGIIVGGGSDRNEIDGTLPSNIEAHYEVSREKYRSLISGADVVVIPLHLERWQRALGHIGMFEAMLMQKPVVAARTFQLTDYASENEVLFYHPGDARHLREQIQRIMQNEAFRNRLVQNAFTRVVNEFTEENYLIRLLETCRDIMGKKASMKS